MAEDKKTGEKAPKGEWLKPQLSLVEAGKAESAPPGQGNDSIYNYS
jgi:hypothetical protein